MIEFANPRDEALGSLASFMSRDDCQSFGGVLGRRHLYEGEGMRINRVYTLTCTWAPSYGATLQAYALAKYINNLGWTAQVINYQPGYDTPGWGQGLLTPIYKVKRYLVDRTYVDFLRDSGMLTDGVYRSCAELERAGLSAEALVVGSDQVWNCTKYFNGKDDAMFLEFAAQGVRKIAYAASLAMPEIPSDQADRYKRLLDRFDAISVREVTGAKALQDIGVDGTPVVVDPVYLIGRSEWEELAMRSARDFSQREYVLVLCLEERDAIYKYARRKADSLGSRLYSLKNSFRDSRRRGLVDRNFWSISVFDYLNLIRNAMVVVTDSFHAMSFSLIFNRDVHVLPRGDNGDSRMIDLLEDLGLTDRIVHSNMVSDKEIDFVAVNQSLQKKVDEAQSFLTTSLQDVSGG